jgi:DHA1 family tetracycline resistance protein-like MFS transporter
VSEREQGELQGAISSIRGLAVLIGPGLFTLTFAYFIDPTKGWVLPGAPWFLGAALLVVAAFLSLTVEQPDMRFASTAPAPDQTMPPEGVTSGVTPPEI